MTIIGLNGKNQEIMERLSKGERIGTEELIGDKFEPQGTVLISPEMKHTKLIVEAGLQRFWVNRIFTVVGVTPHHDFIVLFDNGGTPDYATIDKRDVRQYAPIKNEDGLLIPINMHQLQEMSYIRNAKLNPHHNQEVSNLLASFKYEGDELYKALTQKYI